MLTSSSWYETIFANRITILKCSRCLITDAPNGNSAPAVVRPAFLLGETVDDFIAHWQITRAMSRRGIVEVVAEEAA